MTYEKPPDDLDERVKARLLSFDEAIVCGDEEAAARISGDDLDADAAQELSDAQQIVQLIALARLAEPESISQVLDSVGQIRAKIETIADHDLPTAVGRFRTIRLLGQGGYGIVLLATDPQLNRHVALKLPRPEALVTPELKRRFLREAEAAAALSHPNIVPVYEAGNVGPVYYIASEFIDGPSLDQWIRDHRQPADPRAVTALVAQLAAAVEHAHSRGVLHRDIKPGNVLLRSETTHPTQTSPKKGSLPFFRGRDGLLTDFGLAKIVDEASDHTQTRAVMGTPAYMAPEQAEGDSRNVGTAADIYSLGAILYELLTGRPPFLRDSYLATLEAVRTEEPMPPRRIVPTIDRDLQSICLKCLEKNPARRYKTAAGLHADLDRYLANAPVLARPTKTHERVWRWCRRNPLVASLLSLLVALLVTLAIGSPLAAVAWRAQRDDARRNLSRAEEAEAASRKNEELASRRLCESLVVNARSHRQSGKAGQRFDSLKAVAEASELATKLRLGSDVKRELRTEAIAAMTLADIRPAEMWPGIGRQTPHVRTAFDARVTRYARREFAPNADPAKAPAVDLVIREIADNREVLRVAGALPTGYPFLRLSVDSRLLAAKMGLAGRPNRVVVYDLESCSRLFELPAGSYWHDMALDFSPDGRYLAFAAPDEGANIVDLRNGKLIKRIGFRTNPYALRFDPESKCLAANTESAVQIADVASDKIEDLFEHEASAGGTVNWSPDGRLIAATSGREVHVWDHANDRLLRKWLAHSGTVKYVSFTHDASILATTARGNETRLWEPRTGRRLVDSSYVYAVDFSTDDRWLAVSMTGHSNGRCEVARGDELTTIGEARNDRHGIRAMDVSPDGRILAYSDAKFRLHAIDRAARRPIDVPPEARCYRMQFDPDGKTLWATAHKGLIRYSVQPAADPNGSPSISAPALAAAVVNPSPGSGHLSISGDGQKVAWSYRLTEVRVINPDQFDAPLRLTADGRFQYTAVSPDGKWVGAGPFGGATTRVWNADTGEEVAQFATAAAQVRFSPNGTQFAANGTNELLIIRTDGWKTTHSIAKAVPSTGPVAFSPDGSFLAAVLEPNFVTLIDTRDGRAISRLIPPEAKPIGILRFGPDGAYLYAGLGNSQIQVWDLQRIRRQLGDLGLDW